MDVQIYRFFSKNTKNIIIETKYWTKPIIINLHKFINLHKLLIIIPF